MPGKDVEGHLLPRDALTGFSTLQSQLRKVRTSGVSDSSKFTLKWRWPRLRAAFS